MESVSCAWHWTWNIRMGFCLQVIQEEIGKICICNPCYLRGSNRRIAVQDQARQKVSETPSPNLLVLVYICNSCYSWSENRRINCLWMAPGKSERSALKSKIKKQKGFGGCGWSDKVQIHEFKPQYHQKSLYFIKWCCNSNINKLLTGKWRRGLLVIYLMKDYPKFKPHFKFLVEFYMFLLESYLRLFSNYINIYNETCLYLTYMR
jgi:hypothetical protein